MAVFGIVGSDARRYRRLVVVNTREKAMVPRFKGLAHAPESEDQKVGASFGGIVPPCF
jgi:hypothetical protein